MAEDIEITKAREKTDDRNYYLEIVSENPMLIEWANAEIRDDKEVILKAVNTDGGALEFASDRLKDDKDVVLSAVKNKPIILKYASLRLRDDLEVVLAALESEKEKNNKLIKDIVSFASERIASDDEVKKFLE